jgi:hypothetical protein
VEERYKILERRVRDYCLEHLPKYPDLATVYFTKFFPEQKCPDYDAIFRLKYPKEYQEYSVKELTKK